MFIALIFIEVWKFKCLQVCSTKKYAFVFQFTDALHYILQSRGTEPVDKYTFSRFLDNDEMYVIQRLLACRCDVLRFHYPFYNEKNRIKIFLFLYPMQIHEFYVNIKLVRKRERIENIAH